VKVGQKRILVEKSVVGGRKIVEMAAPSKVDVIVSNPRMQSTQGDKKYEKSCSNH
jgi:hypothetical protein